MTDGQRGSGAAGQVSGAAGQLGRKRNEKSLRIMAVVSGIHCPAAHLPRCSASRADLPHDLQRRPSAGAADGPALRCRKAPRPSASRSARSIRPRSSRSIPPSPWSDCPMTVRWTRPARSGGRWVSGSYSGCHRDPPAPATLSAHWCSAWIRCGSSCRTAGSASPAGAPLYPPDVVVAEPTANLSIRSAQATGQAPSGLLHRWRLLAGQLSGGAGQGGRAGDRHGGARVRSRSEPPDAEVQLLAGTVSRAQPKSPRPSSAMARMEAMADAHAADQFAGEQRVGEFHLYTLPGRSTLLPGLTTSVALFEPAQVKYEKSYVVHGDVPWWGFLPQQGEETEPPVEVDLHPHPSPEDRFRRPAAAGRRRPAVPARQRRRPPAGRRGDDWTTRRPGAI